MAERSFAKEVADLRLGAGQEFRGEGILAITKALLQSGVGYVGAPYADPDALGAAGAFLFKDMKQLPHLVLE